MTVTDVYEDEVTRGADAAAGLPEEVAHLLERGGTIVDNGGPGGAPRFESERFAPPPSVDEAFADGWMAYCAGDRINPYRVPALANAWDDGYRAAVRKLAGQTCSGRMTR